MYVCMYVCMFACMFVLMCVCTYTASIIESHRLLSASLVVSSNGLLITRLLEQLHKFVSLFTSNVHIASGFVDIFPATTS